MISRGQRINNPPKVLHVFDGFRLGGTEIKICNVINHFGRRLKHVIISNNGNFDAARHLKSDIDVSFLHHDTKENLQPWASLKVLNTLKNIDADLMIAYDWGAIDWVLVNRIVHYNPMIMTLEGFEDSELFMQNRRRLLIRRLLYRRCEKVVVCSKTLYNIAIDKWKIQSPRLLHIPNGVDCCKFIPSSIEARGQIREVRLGIVGSLIKLKDHIKLLRCLSELPKHLKFFLQVAGDGPELENLREFCKGKGLVDRVQFLGHVSDTPSLFKKLDIFCLASITEQMPMVILEAMATGLPIISTDVGDIKIMVAEGNKPFIVNKDDDASYIRALKALIENELFRKDIGMSNRRKCLADYDEKLMFSKYEELYFSCIRRG